MRAKTIDDVEEMLWVLQDEIRRSEEARYDHRLHGVLLVAQGMSAPKVAQFLGDGTRTVEVQITLTAPGCGMGDILVDDVRDKMQRIPTVREARVSLTFNPPWNQSMMSEAARLQTGMF